MRSHNALYAGQIAAAEESAISIPSTRPWSSSSSSMSITTRAPCRSRSNSGTTVDLPEPGAPVTTNNLVTPLFSPTRPVRDTRVGRLTFELVEDPGSAA